MEWKYVKPLEDNKAVKKYLEVNHVNLPEELIRIIEKYNGGRPAEKRILTDSREYVFKSLLSYNRDDIETIYKVYPELFENSTLYPIGTDAAGNFICYDKVLKRLVLLNHETDNVETIESISIYS